MGQVQFQIPVQIFSQASSRIALVYQSVCSRTIADHDSNTTGSQNFFDLVVKEIGFIDVSLVCFCPTVRTASVS